MTIFPVAYFELTALTAAVTAGLTGAIAKLYQNNFQGDRNSIAADFTLADYTGYANKVCVWDAPSISDSGIVETHAPLSAWRPTDSTVTNQIYGLFIVEDPGGLLFCSAMFDDPPLPMASTMDVILTTISLQLIGGGFVATVS